ncbi:MAG: peptidoglycan-binding protein [Gammaproteobacteria bacterium]|nr:peptidoglycan-binding protein [Gammaproteobacteria bacterium]
MRTTAASVLAAIAVALALPAGAADDRGQFGVRGAGLVKCAVFEREREARSQIYHLVGAWMDGYITGANQHTDDTYDIASFETTELLAAIVSENCRKNPDAPVFAVLRAVVAQAGKGRLHAPSQKVEVALGERKVLLYEEVLRRVQRKLAAGGFYPGAIDGRYDAITQAALRAYQASAQLQPTGFPDQVTLWRLLHGGS